MPPDQGHGEEIHRQLGMIASDIGQLRGEVKTLSRNTEEHGRVLHDMHEKLAKSTARDTDHTARIKIIEDAQVDLARAQGAQSAWRTGITATYIAVATVVSALAVALALWKSYH